MCGIFGISFKKTKERIESKNLFDDFKTITKISEQRGLDTFGFLIKSLNENFLYKINQRPLDAIKRKDYKNFIINSLNNLKSDCISIIGQTRLVTNGSKFSIRNNQPLRSKNIIGVHNGIFSNLEVENKEEKTINYESIDIKSDSLQFYEKLSLLVPNNDFLDRYLELLKNVKGNYSIAFALNDHSDIFISSNCGSLFYYHDSKANFFAFASEKKILSEYVIKSKFLKEKKFTYDYNLINQCINQTIIFNCEKNCLSILENTKLNKINPKNTTSLSKKNTSVVYSNTDDEKKRFNDLKRCTKCVLPETYPFIQFDNNGVCNFCLRYNKQSFLGEEKLNEFLEKYRSNNNKPDCLVGLSGGRDSCYGLHVLKKKYNMNPIAYTYDWGLTTDIARINSSKICGKLGIEHIIRSANIEKKRSYVRKNIYAWLEKPHLGMLPIVHAGDKKFFDYGRILSKELNLDLVIHCTGVQLEQREFFLGFAGVNQNLKNNQKAFSYTLYNKMKAFLFYGMQFFKNKAYFNSALIDNLDCFFALFLRKDNFLQLFNYEPWNEKTIEETLKDEYEWKKDVSYGNNQWRSGDGQTAFNNFVYYTLAGFSEYDQFRSNQIREDLITRSDAIILCEEDNKIKYETLKIFSEIVGFNLDTVLSKISTLPKLY